MNHISNTGFKGRNCHFWPFVISSPPLVLVLFVLYPHIRWHYLCFVNLAHILFIFDELPFTLESPITYDSANAITRVRPRALRKGS